jgi:hypothetical protein
MFASNDEFEDSRGLNLSLVGKGYCHEKIRGESRDCIIPTIPSLQYPKSVNT